jgi:transcriptional regulator with XRE-family HTH domain
VGYGVQTNRTKDSMANRLATLKRDTLNHPEADKLSPLAAIKHVLRAKRMRAIHIQQLERESGISRPMLSMLLSDNTGPGRDTLCLLLNWDKAFHEPVWRYMLEQGAKLRRDYDDTRGIALDT